MISSSIQLNFPESKRRYDAANAMILDATRLAHLAPSQRAEFAVTSRLLSCLVTESRLRALYFPLSDTSSTGFALILLQGPSATSAFRAPDIQITEVFALIPLHGAPILSEEDGTTNKEITLLDPLDLVPLPLVISKYDQLQSHEICNPSALTTAILGTLNAYGWIDQNTSRLEVCWDPVTFWRNYAKYANLANDLTEEIAQELANSVNWQGNSIS